MPTLPARQQRADILDRVEPLHTELPLCPDRRDVLDGGERLMALLGVRDVGVEQRQVELHVERLLVELAREVHPRLWRVDVLVEREHEVVRDDGIPRGKERDEALDKVALGVAHLLAKIPHVPREVDLFHGPCIANRVAVHLVKGGVIHRTQRQAEPGIEQVFWSFNSVHWQASQDSGFSSEQAICSARDGAPTVALAMRVAGRERR